MKKRLFGTILAVALIVSQAVTIFAAGSKIGEVSLTGDSVGWYELTMIEDKADMPDVTDDAVADKILDVNEGRATLQSIAELASELRAQLEGKDMLSRFFDLIPINGGRPVEGGKYLVTLSVSTLTSSVSNVKLLHYSTGRSAWEIVEPREVDYDNKEITVVFEDLSPVAIIADTSEAAADNTVGTSPKTGTESGWLLWLGAAVVLATAGTMAYKKARR